MERTNIWAKRAHSRDTRDSGDIKSKIPPQAIDNAGNLLSQRRESQ